MNKLNVNAPINGTGYGITSTNIIVELNNLGVEVSLFPIGNQVGLNNPNDKDIIQKVLDNAAFFDYNAPSLKIWHQHDLATTPGKGHNYVFPFFELDTLNDREVHHINYADGVFTASHWSKKVLENNGVTSPIYVCPLGVDERVFTPSNALKQPNDNYVFLHIGKWEKRKSQDFLIEAFGEAFNQNDSVELWLVPHNPFLNEEETKNWLALANSSHLSNKIRIYDRLPTQYHLAQLIHNCDCGVFLSRGEGWNNEVPEVMAMNRPVIVTNYSAHTEYCTPDNSFLVDIDEVEPAIDNKWFHGQGNWAKLGTDQMTQTVKYMKYVYKNSIQENPFGVTTAKQLSWTNTSSIINKTLTTRNSYAHSETE